MIMFKIKYAGARDLSKYFYYNVMKNDKHKANLYLYKVYLRIEAADNMVDMIQDTKMKDHKTIYSILNKEFKKIDMITEVDNVHLYALRLKKIKE